MTEEVILDAAAASKMSREQALRTLAQHGDERDQHRAQMILAGPTISIAEEIKLNDWIPLPPPLTVAVRIALQSLANG